MSVVDEIKSRIDILDLVSANVKLRRSGKNYTGFCPFHANTRTPAFVVFPESGTWRCFGQCNEGGDIFKYVMKKEGWDFPETLKYLAERAGVELQPQTPQKREEEDHYERLRGLLEDAVTFYRHALLQTPAGQPALQYLRKRGLTDATIETFGLGFAPHSWDAALQYFTAKGYRPQELLDAGLASERQEGGGVYDRFRNRIMFPIRDAAGKMSGFGARILDPNDVPKFLNSPQTVLFDKGHLLYGLDQARKAIRAQDQVVIVEGYLDVIALHQGGFTNTVSPMGTALTEEQLRMLKRFTRRIVLALDADAAGEKATLRGLELARQTLDRGDELAFDARGLLRHEARLQADVRVTTLPPGMDPDEVVLRDPQEWAAILNHARPIVLHVMETLAASRDLDDPKAKSDVAAQVLPLIEDVPDAVERDTYRQRLASLLRVDERALLTAGVPATPRPRRRPEIAPRPRRAERPEISLHQSLQTRETLVLRLLLQSPEDLYQVDRGLQQLGLMRFSPQDFTQTDCQLMARLLIDSLEQDGLDPQHYVAENVPEELERLYDELNQPLPGGSIQAEERLQTALRTLLLIRYDRLKADVEQLKQLQQDVQEEDGIRGLTPYMENIALLSQIRDRVDRALANPLQID